jgi:hypothetical protein
MLGLRAVAWALLLGAFSWVGISSLLDGPTTLIEVMPVWLLLVVAERRMVERLGTRLVRVTADLGLALLCALFFWVGGSLVLLAVIAFGIVDILEDASPNTRSRPDPARENVILDAGTALTSLATLAVVLWAPTYSTVVTSISTTNEGATAHGGTSLADVGSPIALGLLILGLAAAVLYAVILDARRARGSRPWIGFVAGTLAILAILGGFSIGLFFVPAAIVAALTFAGSG